MDSCDILVIGGGAAGTAAALAAAMAGARVSLVRRGPGATALARGGWQAAPPRAYQDALSRAGLDLFVCDGTLPHPEGHLVQCDVAPVSHAHAAFVRDDGNAGRTIVIGIDGLPSFHPRSLAALWADAAGLPAGAVTHASIALPETPRAGWSPVALAALLDREPERLGSALAAVVRSARAGRVIVPAVIGLNDHARAFRVVSETAGVRVGEALGTTPSIPGWRLDQALLRALADANVRVLQGSVAGASRDGNRIGGVTIQGDGGNLTMSARAFVLATGKYIGGGITAAREYEEPALGCDVAIERFAATIDDPAAALMLTDPVRSEPQPVLSTGVRLDDAGRPTNPTGDAFASNVFAAGSVRAGVETATFGLGAAAHDGWAVGERAAALASAGS